MPTQHVPPDGDWDPFDELDPFDEPDAQATFMYDRARIQDIAGTLRTFVNGVGSRVRAVSAESEIMAHWMLAEETAESVTPSVPEPSPAPVAERFPRDAVWIMKTPTRRGPGRVSNIQTSTRWHDAYQRVSRWGSLYMDVAGHSGEFTRPRSFSGASRTYRWWFLGWASNGLPMFAVQMLFRVDEEVEISRAIREQISAAVTRLNCHFCYSRNPATTEWPIPAGRASMLNLSGYGATVAVCSGCAAGMEQCTSPGCRNRGHQTEMVTIYVDPLGTATATLCNSHAGTTVRCMHCNARFASDSVRREHNCVGSDLDWERCSVCSNESRLWTLVDYTDGTRQAVCDNPARRCMRGIRQCGLCHGHTRSAVVMAHDSSLVSNSFICTECANGHNVEDCEHCGQNYPGIDSHDCHSGGRCTCDRCQGRVIRGYSFKPRARFQGKDRHGLFLGMELEIFVDRSRSVQDVARSVQDDLGRVGYIKSDASVSHGFEIVTHPMSYEYAMSEFPWQMLATLRDTNSFATSGSGIHIHASRKGFSGASHEYRWMIFLHRNQRQAQVIARRISDQWASFSDDQRRIAKAIATKKARDSNRYRAINQTNSETIEIRIFESSTDEQTVKATLGFVHASIEYARVIRSRDVLHDDAWSWKAFAKWVKNRPEYAPLYAEMERLNVAADEPTQPTYSDPRNGEPEGSERRTARGSCRCDPDLPGCGCDCDGYSDCNGDCCCQECTGCSDQSDPDW